MSTLFESMLAENSVLLADGATGTNLFDKGLQSGDPPELWNLHFPAKISDHYQSFIEAGSDIILTNTFGGNRYRLALHKMESSVAEVNASAVQLAKQSIERSKAASRVAIAGSIGPTGELLEPLGDLSMEAAIAAFEEQSVALAEAGADVLWIETMSAFNEIEAALTAAQKTGLPVVYTLSIDTNGRTMMGLSAADIIEHYYQLEPRPQACGTNCGLGAADVVATLLNFKAATAGKEAPVLIAKANCGLPHYVDGAIVYDGTPAMMATYAVLARAAGATIIGGCCGTTPEHIRQMRRALDTRPVGSQPSFNEVIDQLGSISEGALVQSGKERKTRSRSSRRSRS